MRERTGLEAQGGVFGDDDERLDGAAELLAGVQRERVTLEPDLQLAVAQLGLLVLVQHNLTLRYTTRRTTLVG